MRYRTLDNGDIQFPRRGSPPPDVPNSTRDPGDPYLFHADFVPCSRRKAVATILPCGRTSCSWFCEKFGVTVNVAACEVCESPEN